jgi:hypothetical protein
MKALFLISLLLALPNEVSAAVIKKAALNLRAKSIEVDLVYGGGCKEHKFELQMEGCLESMPVQCTVNVVDTTTDDYCEALIGKRVSFSLEEYNLTDDYFRGASIRIQGENKSFATVRLPN